MGADSPQNLLRHSALLMAATQVANAANLLFQVVMGRTLDPVQYGVLSAMLGVVLVISTPMDALRTMIAHYASRLAAAQRGVEIRALLGRWFGLLSLVAVPVLAAAGLLNSTFSEFFRLGEQRGPIPLTGAILAGSLY